MSVAYERLNGRRIAALMSALADRPLTVAEAAAVAGMHADTIRALLRHMGQTKPRTVYVYEWLPDARGCLVVPAYRLGDHFDAPKPPPLTPGQKMAAKRLREKAPGVPQAEILAMVRAAQ